MDISTLHKSLVTAFSSADSKPDQVRSLLTKLKIGLTENNLLVPSSSSASSSAELVLAREVLEIGAFYSVRIGDIAAFDRYISLLTPFYDASLPASAHYEPLLGLRLLRLLSSNQISAFHTLIETLPNGLVNGSKFLQHPVSLERWLMEGSYSKVWRLSREAPPQDEYRFFVDLLMDMIRNEIASCEEKAYDSLALHDAATLLFFDNLEQVLGFAQSVSYLGKARQGMRYLINVLTPICCLVWRNRGDGKSTQKPKSFRSQLSMRMPLQPQASPRKLPLQTTSSLRRSSNRSSNYHLHSYPSHCRFLGCNFIASNLSLGPTGFVPRARAIVESRDTFLELFYDTRDCDSVRNLKRRTN